MRVMWFSNAAFATGETAGSGSWLGALAQGLTASGEVELCNVTLDEGGGPRRNDTGGLIKQRLVPRARLGRDGLPPSGVVSSIVDIARDFAPDLVHVWGTETYWGLLTARGIIGLPTMLEIQGLKEPCARVFYGGLTLRERARCVGVREFMEGRSIVSARHRFASWSVFEREIIAGHRHITTQSPWVGAWVRGGNRTAHLSHTELALRDPFYSAQPWSGGEDHIVFCSAAYGLPFKGLHDAVRAFAFLSRRLPRARLRVASPAPQGAELRRDGYASWLHRLAAELGVAGRLDWLGMLPAAGIVTELQRCSAMLMPSHCESYSMALAEAMYLGVPAVSARTGGTDWLARDEESALFFNPGDQVLCAHQLERAMMDGDLALALSDMARATAMERHDLPDIVAGQLQRYQSVVSGGAQKTIDPRR